MLLLHGDLVCVCGLVIAAEVEVPLPAVVRFESKTGNGRIFLLLHNSVWSLNSLQLYICPLSETSQFSSSPFKPALFWLAALHEEKMIPRDVIQIKGLKKLCGTECLKQFEGWACGSHVYIHWPHMKRRMCVLKVCRAWCGCDSWVDSMLGGFQKI